MHTPTFKTERALMAEGYCAIAGIDEVGCGALAGPVVAAAAIVPLNSRLRLIRDSKQLSPSQRARLLPILLEKLSGYGIGQASPEEIAQWGIREATLVAMRRAYEALAEQVLVDFVLVDAWHVPEILVPQRAVIRGDQKIKSIAAASIVAKTHRDTLMEACAKEYPDYGFEIHKGYGTHMHRMRLEKCGACPIHRKNFAPVRACLVR